MGEAATCATYLDGASCGSYMSFRCDHTITRESQMDEVYPGVNTVVLDEDTQGLDEPIIKPIKPKKFSTLLSEKGM